MPRPIDSVTVYCSSSAKVSSLYFSAASQLGTALARHRWSLVYGGNNIGLMGALADAVRAGGGKVIGVTPQLFIDKGVADLKCDELLIADSMRHRKQLMEDRGDAFVALPGGLGTLEEIFEIIVAKQLGFHAKPIVLLNIDGFYNPLLAMIDHGIEQRFIKRAVHDLYHVSNTVEDAVRFLAAHPIDRSVAPRNIADAAERID